MWQKKPAAVADPSLVKHEVLKMSSTVPAGLNRYGVKNVFHAICLPRQPGKSPFPDTTCTLTETAVLSMILLRKIF